MRPGLAAGRVSLAVTMAMRWSGGPAGLRQGSSQLTGLEWVRRRGAGWRTEVTVRF